MFFGYKTVIHCSRADICTVGTHAHYNNPTCETTTCVYTLFRLRCALVPSDQTLGHTTTAVYEVRLKCKQQTTLPSWGWVSVLIFFFFLLSDCVVVKRMFCVIKYCGFLHCYFFYLHEVLFASSWLVLAGVTNVDKVMILQSGVFVFFFQWIWLPFWRHLIYMDRCVTCMFCIEVIQKSFKVIH